MSVERRETAYSSTTGGAWYAFVAVIRLRRERAALLEVRDRAVVYLESSLNLHFLWALDSTAAQPMGTERY